MKSIIPFLISLFFVCQISAQHLPQVSPKEVSMDIERLKQADIVINQAIANKEIPGAVLAVVRNEKMVYLKAYGNKELYPATKAMNVNTVFDLASLTKPVSTAISTMILVERGKLRLLDKVNEFIPDFMPWSNAENEKKDIRIIDLMTHTSGLPAYAPIKKVLKEKGANKPDKLINYISTVEREFEPQTDFQYSCLNYITLQRVIETISKQNLRIFAKQNIFDVLGMEHTDYLPVGETLYRTSPTAKMNDGKVLQGIVHDPLARTLNLGVSGNAGLFSDANDLAILVAALQNGGVYNNKRILSPMSVRTMRTVPRNTQTIGRTPGWDLFTPYSSNNGDLFGPNTYGHTGYTGTSITIDPDSNTGVIFLTNRAHPDDGGTVIRLRSFVANIVASSIMEVNPEDATETMPPKEATKRPYHDHYYKRLVEFRNEKPIDSKSIVMLGNSITEGGGNWSSKLNNKHIRNRGIVGDRVRGVYERLDEITKGKPKKIFLMIGINDVGHQQPTDFIVNEIAKVIEKIKADSPKTTVYLQSILPINESFGLYTRLNGKADQVPKINAKLKTMAKSMNITYIDLFPHFVIPNSNTLRPNFTGDGVHISEEGYQIWRKILKKYL